MKKSKTFFKGNRVKFELKGAVKYGVVFKGGREMVVVIEDGGMKEFKGHADWFELSEHPLLKDEPSDMDRYSLKGYKEINGHGDSRTFEAIILENDKPILTVSNDGWGGCNFYASWDYKGLANGKTATKAWTDFFSAVKSWVTQFGYPDISEPSDAWVEWYQHRRPYGVTAKQEIGDYIELMAKIKNS